MKLCGFLRNKSPRIAKNLCAFAACAVLALLVFSFAAALIAAFAPAFTPIAHNVPADGQRTTRFPEASAVIRAAVFTVRQAFFSTLIAVAVGFPAAFFLSQRNFFGQKFLSALAAVPLAFPALLLAIGFVSVFGIRGVMNKMLPAGMNTPLLYSFYGIITVQGFYNFPFIMKSCADAWGKLRREEKNAAIMLGARPFRVFRTITLVQLLPSILSSSALVFLFCYFSFIIVLLFGAVGTSTLEVEIYYAVRAAANIKTASVLALVETAIALVLAAAAGHLQKNSSKSRGHSLGLKKSKLNGAAEKTAFAALMCLIIVFLLMPIASIVFYGINPHTLVPLLKAKSFFAALKTTVVTSFFAALFSVAAASVYCCLPALKKERAPRNFLPHIIPLLPMAVSSIVMGLGIMMLVKQGNAFVYVIARASLLWTLAFKQISPAFNRVSNDVIRAAKMLSVSRIDAVFSVLLPETMRASLSAFAFCFAASAADASLPLMLAIPRFDTLALYAYRLAGSYRINQACAAGTVLIALCAGVFLITDRIASLQRKPL